MRAVSERTGVLRGSPVSELQLTSVAGVPDCATTSRRMPLCVNVAMTSGSCEAGGGGGGW